MRYLLDTSVLIHSLVSSPRLNHRALHLLGDLSSDLYLSSVSSWEISIKVGTRKLSLPERPGEFITRAIRLLSLHTLDITLPHTLAVGALPNYHQDPFDRLLIAQANSEGMTILTDDKLFQKYAVEQVYCGR